MGAEEFLSTSPEIQDWHQLHRAAMQETDPKKLLSRIIEAEEALAHRSRILFSLPGDNLEELEKIDDARHILRALSFCLRPNSDSDFR